MVRASRLFKHLASTHWQVRRAFPAAAMTEIAAAIRESETCHLGEIRFVVEGALEFSSLLHNQTARERALEVFSLLRVWDTEHNNGILIYLLFADRDVEIIADRGIDARVGAAEWEGIGRAMEEHFRRREFVQGVKAGIQAIDRHLSRHFPAAGTNPNELPDQPTVL
jgi:uncharacterized membrane protein